MNHRLLWGLVFSLVVGMGLSPAAGAPVLTGKTNAAWAGSKPQYQVFLPLVMQPPRPYVWHKVGFSNNLDLRQDTRLLSGHSNYWYQNWWPRCDDPFDPQDTAYGTGLRRHVPMVRPPTLDIYRRTLVNSPCNDGRPLLVLNEPEMADQDGQQLPTPADALDFTLQVVNSGWRGPIYAGGIMAGHGSFVDEMLKVWASRNNGSRMLPGIAGWHLHAYLNTVGSIYGVDDQQLWQIVSANTDQLREFIAERRAEGNPTDVVISEFGWLGRTVADGRHDQDMLRVLKTYVEIYDTIPEIKAWAWFADWTPSGTEPACCVWDMSNLLVSAGNVYQTTAVGDLWRSYLTVYP